MRSRRGTYQRIGRKVRDKQMSRVVQATVLDVLGPRMSVRLASNGSKLHGIRFVGGPVSVGAKVEVDYSSGQPIAMCQGEAYVPDDVNERPVPDKQASIPEAPWDDSEEDPATSPSVEGTKWYLNFKSGETQTDPNQEHDAETTAYTGTHTPCWTQGVDTKTTIATWFWDYGTLIATSTSGVEVNAHMLITPYTLAGPGPGYPTGTVSYRFFKYNDDTTITYLCDEQDLHSAEWEQLTVNDTVELTYTEFASDERLAIRFYYTPNPDPTGAGYYEGDAWLTTVGTDVGDSAKLYVILPRNPGSVDYFSDLLDTPDNYTSQANKHVAVNSLETGLEFVTDTGGDHAGYHADYFNGTFVESFRFYVTESGGTVTGSLFNALDSNDDLTMRFSTGYFSLECGPSPATITLTAGTTTVPQGNFVYIPLSTKVLTVSTSDWPSEEHIKVATVYLLDDTSTNSYGALVNANWNDHSGDTGGIGHSAHIGDRLRMFFGHWYSGAEGTLTITSGSPDQVEFSCTAGKVFQFHKQDFDAFDMNSGDSLNIVNDYTSPYKEVTDLATELTDAENNSLSGKYYWLVFWGVNNSGTEPDHVMCNLPTGSYSLLATAQDDDDATAVYDIPFAFRNTGFLISAHLLKHSSAGGGTWTEEKVLDLRGKTPNISAGGGGGGGGASTFLALTDTPSAFTSSSGKLAAVNSGETALEFIDPDTVGTTTFTGLTDTPSSFTASKWLKVNAGGTAIEWTDEPAGGGGASGAGALDPWWQFDGAVASSGSPLGTAWICPRTATIESVYIYAVNTGTSTGSSSIIADIHKNGTTIFTTQGNRPELMWNDADNLVESTTPDVTSLTDGDILTIYLDQVTDGATDVTVLVKMSSNANSFLGLTDTPATWSGTSPGQVVQIASGGSTLEFATPSAGGASTFDIWLYG